LCSLPSPSPNIFAIAFVPVVIALPSDESIGMSVKRLKLATSPACASKKYTKSP